MEPEDHLQQFHEQQVVTVLLGSVGLLVFEYLPRNAVLLEFLFVQKNIVQKGMRNGIFLQQDRGLGGVTYSNVPFYLQDELLQVQEKFYPE